MTIHCDSQSVHSQSRYLSQMFYNPDRTLITNKLPTHYGNVQLSDDGVN